MRFAEIVKDTKASVAESFSKPLPFEWRAKRLFRWATFNTAEYDYRAEFSDCGDGIYWFFFCQQGAIGGDDNWRTDLAQTGQSHLVMSTVIAIAKDFIQKHKPNVLEFTAKGKSRESLYIRLAKTLSKGSGYNLTYEQRDDELCFLLTLDGYKADE